LELAIDIKKQNKEALKWILNFYDLRRSYIDSSAMFNAIGAVVNDGMPRGTDTSNPCANKAISLAELERQKKWIITIESMEQTLSEKSREYLRLRREAEHQIQDTPGRPGWYNYVNYKYSDWFYNRYGKSSYQSLQTLIDWMHQMIDITVRIAIKNGCL
jgi:hypothetical protein